MSEVHPFAKDTSDVFAELENVLTFGSSISSIFCATYNAMLTDAT